MATQRNIGQILIDKAKSLDPSYQPDKFNDLGEAVDIILNKLTAASGGSSSPEQPEVLGEALQTIWIDSNEEFCIYTHNINSEEPDNSETWLQSLVGQFVQLKYYNENGETIHLGLVTFYNEWEDVFEADEWNPEQIIQNREVSIYDLNTQTEYSYIHQTATADEPFVDYWGDEYDVIWTLQNTQSWGGTISAAGGARPIPYPDQYMITEDWGAYDTGVVVTNIANHHSGAFGYLGFENGQQGVSLLHDILDAWHNHPNKIIEIDCPACGAICEVEDVQYNQPVNPDTDIVDVNIKIRVGYRVELEDDDYMNWLYHSTYRIREYFSYEESGSVIHCYIESVATETCANCKFVTEVSLPADEIVVGADLSEYITMNCVSPVTVGNEAWDQNHTYVFKDEDFISYLDGYDEHDSTVKYIYITYKTINRSNAMPECYATMTVYYSDSMDEQYKTWVCPAWRWME